MQHLKLKGNNITAAGFFELAFCISNIEKLSGIERIDVSSKSSRDISQILEIVKKMDEPVNGKSIIIEVILFFWYLVSRKCVVQTIEF